MLFNDKVFNWIKEVKPSIGNTFGNIEKFIHGEESHSERDARHTNENKSR